MGRHGMRWEELRWDELRWSASVKCGVWGVKSAMWSVRKVFALYRGRAQVMFLDSNTATASHKARTHGPGWRTAHASSLVVVLGSDSWKLRWHMRWDEKRWAGIRWEELRWDEVWSVKSALWSVGREECSVKCGVWRKQWEVRVWSVDCEVWSVKCGVWSVKCGLGRVQCEVRSVECEVWSVQCGVWRVQWEVWRAKWSFKCDMWNRTPLSQSARTHGLGWRTAHASSIDEKGLIYIFKATSAPPRAGTTGIEIRLYIWLYIYVYIYIHKTKLGLCNMNRNWPAKYSLKRWRTEMVTEATQRNVTTGDSGSTSKNTKAWLYQLQRILKICGQ